MAAGDGHTAIIGSNGALAAGGDNYYGQLGDGTSTDRITSIDVDSDVAAVFAGYSRAFWIKSDRSLWATGAGSDGALGDGGTGNRYVPAQIATNVATMAVGGGHMAFVKTDGTLWTAGSNWNGELATGNTTSRSIPGQVATGVAAVAAGGDHTLFLKTDGSLWGCGNNYDGQLGDGTRNPRSAPFQIATAVAGVSAAGNSSYFIKTDGTLWAMGNNEYGQLGDGTTSDRLSPVLIANGVQSVKPGRSHALFLKTDNTLWAMGSNSSRQLADGTTAPRYVPAQVATSVVEVAAGGDHTLYRKSDQTVWGAGENYYGDFGLGYGDSDLALAPMFGLPAVSSAPTGSAVDPGTYLTLSVTAAGPGPITYQWRKNNLPISGATSATYSFFANEDREGDYTVIVTGREGSVTTLPATISVNDPPAISNHPTPAASMPGQPAMFSVEATGTGPLTYQWRRSSTSIPGATNATFSIASVTIADAGNYTCVVTSQIGSVTSNIAALTVGPAITGQPQNRVGTAGTSGQFSVTATGTSPTYQWRRNQLPISGATFSTYTMTLSKALEGSYDVIVTNAAGSVTSEPASLTVNEGVTFTTSPRGAVLQPGAPLLLEVVAAGTAPFTYQWRKGGVAIPGATEPTLSIASVSVANEGLYTCAVTNVAGTATTASADIRIAPMIVVPPAGGTVNPGAKVTFSVQASGSGTLSYAWRKNGVNVGVGPAYVIDGASEDDEAAYSVLVTSTYGSVLSAPAQLVVNDAPKFKTQPQSVTVKPGAAASFSVEMLGSGNFTYQWRHDGSDIPGATRSFHVIEPADESSTGVYDVVVTGATGTVTSAAASLDLDLRPTIERNPTSRAARLGATVTLEVEASGAGPLTYQWFRNHGPIAGATSPALLLENLQPAAEGNYTVEVSNAAGATLSAPAQISLSEWVEIAGAYQALFIAENAAAETNPWPGRLTVTVTSRGAFSGRLECDGLSHPVSGALGNDLTFSRRITRGTAPALQLFMRFSPGTGEARLDAQIGPDGSAPTALHSTARNTHHARLNPTLQAGRYVMVLDRPSDSVAGPLAPGYALLRVSASGGVSLTGKLPDGAKLSCGSLLGEDDVFALYQRLYRPVFSVAGALAGPVTLAAIPSDQAVAGNLWWHKPAQSSGAYPDAFSNPMAARGAFYEPLTGEPLLDVPQGSIGLAFESDTANAEPLFDAPVVLSAQNRFTVPAKTQKLVLQFDARTGQIRGSFTEPGTNARRLLEGVMLPGLEAVGFFSTGSAAGLWTVRPQ